MALGHQQYVRVKLIKPNMKEILTKKIICATGPSGEITAGFCGLREAEEHGQQSRDGPRQRSGNFEHTRLREYPNKDITSVEMN